MTAIARTFIDAATAVPDHNVPKLGKRTSGEARGRSFWRARPAAPRITGLYCSELGTTFTNRELYAINAKHLLPRCGEETRALYEKLLLREPDRERRFITPYEQVVTEKDPVVRADRFRDVSLRLLEDAARGALAQTNLGPKDIDILLVTCMAGKTLPSLAALVSGRLGFREDVCAVNLGDMGCSAGMTAFDTGLRLLRGEKHAARALVLALEPVTNLFQSTDDPGGVVGNTLFGEGCAGVVISTHREAALYHIGPTQRVLQGDDTSAEAITLRSTQTGPMIQLSKEIPQVAGSAIEKNLKKLVPRFLPLRDKLAYLLLRRMPQWQTRVDRWALHPGGAAVLRGLEKQLKLSSADLGPSYEVFHKRSNMSSPSVFYALDNIEKLHPRVGERVLMMSFGSGFKVATAVLTKGDKRSCQVAQRHAVVVGGTSGIGEATARSLLAQGYRVVVASRRVVEGEARIPGAEYLTLDVTQSASVQAFAEKVWRLTFGIDVLVVSSGVAQEPEFIGAQDDAAISNVVNTNLTGAMLLINRLLPQMRTRSSIFLMNSILGQIPLMNNAVYCAAKAGLKHYAEVLDIELRRKGRRVAVHSLFPAYVQTPMLEQVSGKSKLMLRPMTTDDVVAHVARLMGERRSKASFLLGRDRAIAMLYKALPGLFKWLVCRMGRGGKKQRRLQVGALPTHAS